MHRCPAIFWLKSLLKAKRPGFRTFNFIPKSNFVCLCNLTHLFVNCYIFMLEDKVRPFYHFISCSKIAQGCYEKGTSFLFFHKTHNLSLVIKKKIGQNIRQPTLGTLYKIPVWYSSNCQDREQEETR